MRTPIELVILSMLAASFLTARPAAGQVAGTYRVAVCKSGPCTPADTAHALVWGLLVLNDEPLPFASLPDSARRLRVQYSVPARSNACYALHRASGDPQTYAGIRGAGTTRWLRDTTSGLLEFGLYRSPDARHVVRAALRGDTLSGTGTSSGPGIAAVDYPRDTIVALRVGPPDLTKCADASARESRRLQDSRP
jgi:hypothetical protein